MKCRSILVSVLAAALLICVAGCQKETATVFPGEDETYSEELATLGVSNRFAGVVCASGETKVEKDESKAVAKIKVEAGDIVKKGQLLFTYDS